MNDANNAENPGPRKKAQRYTGAQRPAEAGPDAPAVMDDCLTVNTWVESISGARLVLAQQIDRNNDHGPELPSDGHASDKNIPTRLATLTVTLACIDDRGRPVRLPTDIRDSFMSQHLAVTGA